MSPSPHPALVALLAQLGDAFCFGEVSIRPAGHGFELRHADDLGRPTESVDATSPAALRELAQTTATGAFRPNKAAPNLRRGWHAMARDRDELAHALDALYPGGVADWFAAQQTPQPVTSYREFTARQTGMYAVTRRLTSLQAAAMTRACCHARFCGRQRLWTADSLPPDRPAEKSVIPCLEPCALLLEFARCVAKLETDERSPAGLTPDELALPQPDPAVREGDTAHPANPRRLQWLRERLTTGGQAQNSVEEV